MKETPMMKQYMGFKRQYPDKVILFRMGDFYETFGEDAKIVSKILNITLTTRDKNSDPTPLAGFPYHALDNYLPKLVEANINAVVVDQIEDPKDAKGVVKRGVTRVVTPGTLDGDLAKDEKNPYLTSVFLLNKILGIAYCDLSTGELHIGELEYSKNEIERVLNSIDPVEVLICDSEDTLFIADKPVQIVELGSKKIDSHIINIQTFYRVSSLESLGIESLQAGLFALSILLSYIEDTQKMIPEHIVRPKLVSFTESMPLDSSTIRNLDLIKNSYTGLRDESLIDALDFTNTPMGKRVLYNWILNPLLSKEAIEKRNEVVKFMSENENLLSEMTDYLSNVGDVERIVGKIGLNRATPRDLKSLQSSLESFGEILEKVKLHKELKSNLLGGGKELTSSKQSISGVIEIIDRNIVDDPPNSVTEGGIIKKGINKEIDEIRAISQDSKGWLKSLERDERKKYGIPSLKVSYNRVFGYYIEVTKTHLDKVPDNYIRKQTLVNSERYITTELKEKEDIILNSDEKLAEMEYKYYQELREDLLEYINGIRNISEIISRFDVLCGFANISRLHDYVKPTLYPAGKENGVISIKNGRHPVVERLTSEQFISNDTYISTKKERMIILTGPNMSGKSTYIRQVALIVLMAQIGCFVPASKAKISIVDRIFSRVGASDNLSQGRSTFMVEMEEAANIVNNASKNSLIVLDEVGRGTSTYDGVSIAWALVEYLVHTIGARTLFATHYHELTSLEEENPQLVKNYNVGVKEQGDEVIFLRSINEGGTDKSYGIYVAQMAGIPQKIIDRANSVMDNLVIDLSNGTDEKKEGRTVEKVELQYALFAESKGNNEIIAELEEIDPNKMTPLEALQFLQELKDILEQRENQDTK